MWPPASPPDSGNHCSAHVIKHEIPLSHEGMLLDSAWQVLQLVFGRQAAEISSARQRKVIAEGYKQSFLFFFFNINLGNIDPVKLLSCSLLLFHSARHSAGGGTWCQPPTWPGEGLFPMFGDCAQLICGFLCSMSSLLWVLFAMSVLHLQRRDLGDVDCRGASWWPQVLPCQ